MAAIADDAPRRSPAGGAGAPCTGPARAAASAADLVAGRRRRSGVAIAVAVGVVATGDDAGEGGRDRRGTELAPAASATAASTSWPPVWPSAGRRRAASGARRDFYQGWVRLRTTATWSAVGTFHLRGGGAMVTLWSGVALDDYPTLTVTLQRRARGRTRRARSSCAGRSFETRSGGSGGSPAPIRSTKLSW